MSGIQRTIWSGLLGAVVVSTSSTAIAQAPRGSVAAPVSTGVPEFRDPDTGRVWTPETVGQDGRPVTGPDDKAFDPGAQSASATGVEQRVRGTPVGTVPITAGPTVPIANLDGATLRAVPGQRWRAVMYLNNNSGNAIDPVLVCRFTNGGNTVMMTRVLVQQIGPGVRQGLAVYGPRTDAFVDRVACEITAP